MKIKTVEKYYNELVPGNFTYQVTYDNGQISFVPINEANRHYQEIQQWIADGGTVIDNPPE
tara:strand:- start:218 stop:400 length:183 start_codon:yes stop_codon:yes gene_type:complete